MPLARTTLSTGEGFPAGFLWGAATASYQIEGAACEDGRGESIWDRFAHTPGKVANGDTGDVACDHYHRYRDDIALMRELGLNAYRFSIAWPRIFPLGNGPLNPAGIAFYDRLVDALLEAGIEPWVTLYHWDLPQTLEDRGGWPNPETARYFGTYAQACFDALGDRVRNWITLNEPWVSAHVGYASGEHAPGSHDQGKALAAGHTLLLAHGEAVERFRATIPEGRVGITLNLGSVHAATDSEADRAAAGRWNAYLNRWFLDPIYNGDYPSEMRSMFGSALPAFSDAERARIQAPVDFVGVNYYSRSIMRDNPGAGPLRIAGAVPPAEAEVTGMGWEIYPRGLYETLMWVQDTYDTPQLYITENGAGYEESAGPDGYVDDQNRLGYLREHFASARDAIADGARLGGYFVWSLLDNFEWGFGFEKRFGIVRVDYDTQRRTPKASARWYAKFIRDNAAPRE